MDDNSIFEMKIPVLIFLLIHRGITVFDVILS
jgi:hypothetical protein